jgi:hypothetical protein
VLGKRKKLPWELTREEFVQQGAGRAIVDQFGHVHKTGEGHARVVEERYHAARVQYAVEDGLPVPRAVLEDYRGEPWADAALAKIEKGE